MNFQEALTKKQLLEAKCDEYSAKLKELVGDNRTCLGLTSDLFKSTKEYKVAKLNYNEAFRQLREFNTFYVKQFKVELAEQRKNKRQEV